MGFIPIISSFFRFIRHPILGPIIGWKKRTREVIADDSHLV